MLDDFGMVVVVILHGVLFFYFSHSWPSGAFQLVQCDADGRQSHKRLVSAQI